MIAAGVSSLKRQLTISVCLANEAPYSASSFEGNPYHLTNTNIFKIVNQDEISIRQSHKERIIRNYANRRNGGKRKPRYLCRRNL